MGIEEPLTGMEVLRQQPFLRLLFPLVVGIVCGDAFPHPCPWGGFLAFSVGLLGLLYECHRRGRTLLYGGLVSFLLACIGYQLAAWQLSGTFRHYPETEVACRVRVCEVPEEKERSLLCPVRVLGIYADSSFCAEPRPPLYLFYFPKDTASARLRRGDELLVYARLSSPRNNGNPDEEAGVGQPTCLPGIGGWWGTIRCARSVRWRWTIGRRSFPSIAVWVFEAMS